MSWEYVSRELRELLDICDEEEAFLVSFDLRTMGFYRL